LSLVRPTADFETKGDAVPFSLSAEQTCVHLVPCNSLITRLALQIEKPDFWSVWQGFLLAIRQCVATREPIAAITSRSVQLTSSMLNQKITCIAIQLRKPKRKRKTGYAFTADQVDAIERGVRKDTGCHEDLFDVVHTVMMCPRQPQTQLERRFPHYQVALIRSIRSFCFSELYDPVQQSMIALDWLFGCTAKDLMPTLVFIRCCWECENIFVPEYCPALAVEKAELESWLHEADGWMVPVKMVEEAVTRVAELEKKVLWIEELTERFGEAEFVWTLAQQGSALVSVQDIEQRMSEEEQPKQTVQVVLTGEGDGHWQRLCVVVEGKMITYGRAFIERC
jgi:hypothetical protein